MRSLLVVLAATVALAGAACSSDDPTTATTTTAASKATGTITVSAAASLTEAFTKIGEQFKTANPDVTEVKFNFDASSALVTQIQSGAPADVFASADEANMTELTDGGLVAGTPEIFARNELTIVVKPGNPKGVTSLADLATVGVVSQCGSDVPCGKYADQALTKAGVTIPADQVTRGQNVKATLSAVAEGDADAGIVYLTDVTDEVDAVKIPDDVNVIASYPIAALKASNDTDTAQAFVDYVLGEPGQAVLADAGFMPPG